MARKKIKIYFTWKALPLSAETKGETTLVKINDKDLRSKWWKFAKGRDGKKNRRTALYYLGDNFL